MRNREPIHLIHIRVGDELHEGAQDMEEGCEGEARVGVEVQDICERKKQEAQRVDPVVPWTIEEDNRL